MWFELSMEKVNGDVEEIDEIFKNIERAEQLADDLSVKVDSNSEPVYKGFLIHGHFDI